jgi:hypothetical protein
MAMEAPVRRMTAAVVFFFAFCVISSIWRGDSPGMTVAYAVAVLVGGGVVIGGYLWARRKN